MRDFISQLSSKHLPRIIAKIARRSTRGGARARARVYEHSARAGPRPCRARPRGLKRGGARDVSVQGARCTRATCAGGRAQCSVCIVCARPLALQKQGLVFQNKVLFSKIRPYSWARAPVQPLCAARACFPHVSRAHRAPRARTSRTWRAHVAHIAHLARARRALCWCARASPARITRARAPYPARPVGYLYQKARVGVLNLANLYHQQ